MDVVVAGATGLVGREVVKLLQARDDIKAIHLLVRRPWPYSQQKIKLHQISSFTFAEIEKLQIPSVHRVFCCLGTTIKKAGSQSEFRSVDYEAVLNLAKWSMARNAEIFAVVSALGANPHSNVFYNRADAGRRF